MKCWASNEMWTSLFQIHSLQTVVFVDGNCVFTSLLHHVRHLALCARAAPEVRQQGGEHTWDCVQIRYGLPFSGLEWPVVPIAIGSVTVYSWLSSIPTVITDEQLPHLWFTAWLTTGAFCSPDVRWYLGEDTEGASDLEWIWNDSDRRPNVRRLHVQRTHCCHHNAQLLCDWMWVLMLLYSFNYRVYDCICVTFVKG